MGVFFSSPESSLFYDAKTLLSGGQSVVFLGGVRFGLFFHKNSRYIFTFLCLAIDEWFMFNGRF